MKKYKIQFVNWFTDAHNDAMRCMISNLHGVTLLDGTTNDDCVLIEADEEACKVIDFLVEKDLLIADEEEVQ